MADVNQEWRNLVSRLGMQTRESDIEPTAEMLEEYFNKASQIAMGLDIHCDPTNPALDMLQVIVPSRTFALTNAVCHCSSRGLRCASLSRG